MTKPPVIALDFDGTMTDAEAEGLAFTDGYLDDLAALTGQSATTVRAIAYRTFAEILERPNEFPFVFGKPPLAVAPAIVDPYLRMSTIANRVLDAFKVFVDRDERDRLLSGVLYRHNYRRTVEQPVFRIGAAGLLRALGKRADLAVYVVTNSSTHHVSEKIMRLDREAGGGIAWLADRVRGNASKFVVDPSWTGAPAPSDLTIRGLDRPILRKRRRYHAILEELCAGAFERLTVLGDIFELDLALPEALGARVALVKGPYTPSYEIDYLSGKPGHAKVVSDLSEVLDFIALPST